MGKLDSIGHFLWSSKKKTLPFCVCLLKFENNKYSSHRRACAGRKLLKKIYSMQLKVCWKLFQRGWRTLPIFEFKWMEWNILILSETRGESEKPNFNIFQTVQKWPRAKSCWTKIKRAKLRNTGQKLYSTDLSEGDRVVSDCASPFIRRCWKKRLNNDLL